MPGTSHNHEYKGCNVPAAQVSDEIFCQTKFGLILWARFSGVVDFHMDQAMFDSPGPAVFLV